MGLSMPNRTDIESTLKIVCILFLVFLYFHSCSVGQFRNEVRASAADYCYANHPPWCPTVAQKLVDIGLNSGILIHYVVDPYYPRLDSYPLFVGWAELFPPGSLGIFLFTLLTNLFAVALLIVTSILAYHLVLLATHTLKGVIIPLDRFLAWSAALASVLLLLVIGNHLPIWTLLFPGAPLAYGFRVYLGALLRSPTTTQSAQGDPLVISQEFYGRTTDQEESINPDNQSDDQEVIMENPKGLQRKNNYLAVLYQELEEIMRRDDRSLIEQRVDAIVQSIDARTYEIKLGSWTRKHQAAIVAVENINKAERVKNEHDLMPLERQEREARLKADIEHHKAREAEAKMRQRMANEE